MHRAPGIWIIAGVFPIFSSGGLGVVMRRVIGNDIGARLMAGEWWVLRQNFCCFRDRAARPEGRTTPPTDPDERN
jgi:hypothetical protein